jgi:hypothetical protein
MPVATTGVTRVKSLINFLKMANVNSTLKKERLFTKKSIYNCGMTSHTRGSISGMPIMDLTGRCGDTITVLAALIIMARVSLPFSNQPVCGKFLLNGSTGA